jgi:hypothetical protein
MEDDFTVIWSTYFVAIRIILGLAGIFSPFWYVVPRKILVGNGRGTTYGQQDYILDLNLRNFANYFSFCINV